MNAKDLRESCTASNRCSQRTKKTDQWTQDDQNHIAVKFLQAAKQRQLGCMRGLAMETLGLLVLSLSLALTASKTDRVKRAHFSFGGKLLTDKKSARIVLRSIFNPTHHSLPFCLDFLPVRMNWVRKCCERILGLSVCSIPCQKLCVNKRLAGEIASAALLAY